MSEVECGGKEGAVGRDGGGQESRGDGEEEREVGRIKLLRHTP